MMLYIIQTILPAGGRCGAAIICPAEDMGAPTWARRRFFLCATAPKETTPQRGPGDWPRGSSSIAICGSLIREIPSDFISGGSYMNHSSFLTS